MRAAARVVPALVLAGLVASAPARAGGDSFDANWIESGDSVLRIDLELLNDAGIIRLPVTQWPMPRAALVWALENAKEHLAVNSAVTAALARTRARVANRRPGLELEAGVIGGRGGLLRDFDAFGREDAELHGRAGYSNGRVSVALNVAAVLDPADGQELRADGSHATLALGNWLVSAHTLDRFWGPGHESSLVLSNNARPMPSLMLERATPRPFETPWLSWLGPWRFSFGVGRMEEERRDIDAPLFLAWRVTVMPFRKMEFGFTRTAQFCGRQLACSLTTFKDLLIGRDNPGSDAGLVNEPGNQMAGFDIRWTSPIGQLPYAIYSQMIGEDESAFLPVKYLQQFGAEVWRPLPDGGLVQGFAEFADTSCTANRSPLKRFNCAYTQHQFFAEGYRYRGRVVGHTFDADAAIYSAGATLTTTGGELWSVTGRFGDLNQDVGVDPNNSVSTAHALYRGLELGWRGKLFGAPVSVELGADYRKDEGGVRDIEVYGFVGWRYEFDQ